MASNLEALRYYMDGPGEVLVMASDFAQATPDANKIIASVTCKTASFTGSTSQENVTGGRSIFPRRKFLTEKTVQFVMEDCEMDFRYVSLSQGEDIVTGAATNWAFGDDETYTIDSATHKVTLKETPLADTLVVQFLDGTFCTSSETAPAASGDYQLSAKELTFNTADDGKVIKCVYQYTTGATTKSVATKSDSLPKVVSIVHKMPMFDENNTIKGYQYIEIYKAQTSSEFEEAFAEKAAYAPRLTFDVVDAKRTDKKLVDHRFIPVAAS